MDITFTEPGRYTVTCPACGEELEGTVLTESQLISALRSIMPFPKTYPSRDCRLWSIKLAIEAYFKEKNDAQEAQAQNPGGPREEEPGQGTGDAGQAGS